MPLLTLVYTIQFYLMLHLDIRFLFVYPITSATTSSNKNGITPTYITPSSSDQSLRLPSNTTILRKKSPVFLREKVSCAFFSGVSTFNAD